MNRTERLYRIDQLLASRNVVDKQTLMDDLEVSWATLKRDIAYMRERLNAPIVFDSDQGGYCFSAPITGPKYELPGLWFSPDETYALLNLHQLLSELEPGLLGPHVAPLLLRLEAIVAERGDSFNEVAKRIRLAKIGTRKRHLAFFEALSRALLRRQQIHVAHFNRSKILQTERILSPQRLMFYRNNWYLEAWCHDRNALRSFSVDAFRSVDVLNQSAIEISESELDAEFSRSYGIYSGQPNEIAILRFSPDAARWVADEQWHPDQIGQFDADGCYLLKVPYAQPTELVMDILRHGRHVSVLGPDTLREQVKCEMEAAIQAYVT
jgi:predicted DNA-binding transcriptional regulator YafY